MWRGHGNTEGVGGGHLRRSGRGKRWEDESTNGNVRFSRTAIKIWKCFFVNPICTTSILKHFCVLHSVLIPQWFCVYLLISYTSYAHFSNLFVFLENFVVFASCWFKNKFFLWFCWLVSSLDFYAEHVFIKFRILTQVRDFDSSNHRKKFFTEL